MNLLETSVAVGTLLAMTTGAALYVAPKSEVERVNMRVTQHINDDMAKAALQRMWMLEARYGGQICCERWNPVDIALWKEAKAEYDKAMKKDKKGEGDG